MSDPAVMPVLSINVGSPQHPDGTASGQPTTPSLLFSMVPEDVRRDPRLTHCDIHVYVELAGARERRGNLASIGERLLATYCRIDRRAVRDTIAKLVKCGHVVVEKASRKRARYRLASPLFGSDGSDGKVNPPGVSLSPAPRAALFCSDCRRRVRSLGKTGTCRTCIGIRRTEKIADRVARKVVSAHLAESGKSPIAPKMDSGA